MSGINLLPHREASRRRRRSQFGKSCTLSVAVGGLVVGTVIWVLDHELQAQVQNNVLLRAESGHLDRQIREIANLRQEIVALRARQQAVEALERDRTVPVHLLAELVRLIPEGAALRQVRREDQRVTLQGLAHSNDRVATLLANLDQRSPWVGRPELLEIKALAAPPTASASAVSGPGAAGMTPASLRDPRRMVEFSVALTLKPAPDERKPLPRDKDPNLKEVKQ
jgi:type IV pilus assembly protein PilN